MKVDADRLRDVGQVVGSPHALEVLELLRGQDDRLFDLLFHARILAA